LEIHRPILLEGDDKEGVNYTYGEKSRNAALGGIVNTFIIRPLKIRKGTGPQECHRRMAIVDHRRPVPELLSLTYASIHPIHEHVSGQNTSD
jgi:hypothetical protein